MGTSSPGSRPDREAAAEKRRKFATTGEASRMLGGVIAPGVLRAMALKGEIRGSLLVRDRVYIPRYVVPNLVKELEFSARPTPKRLPRPQPNTFDALRAR
jgi:hypothetical protein